MTVGVAAASLLQVGDWSHDPLAPVAECDELPGRRERDIARVLKLGSPERIHPSIGQFRLRSAAQCKHLSGWMPCDVAARSSCRDLASLADDRSTPAASSRAKTVSSERC